MILAIFRCITQAVIPRARSIRPKDYEKGVSNADWTPALNSLAQLGSVPALPAAALGDIIGALAPTYGAGTAQTVGLLITDAATGIPGSGFVGG
jgi:hypothetical protein